MAGDIIALDDAGNRQPVRNTARGCSLLQEIAGGAVADNKEVKVESRLVQGHKVDQPVHRIPAADKAGEAQDHAGWQAEDSFAQCGYRGSCQSAQD